VSLAASFRRRARVAPTSTAAQRAQRTRRAEPHSHGAVERASNSRRIAVVAIPTALFFAVEVAAGLSLHSLALLADAMHMLSDLLALLLGYYASRAALRGPSEDATFGGVRMEVVGGLVNGVFLLAVCFTILLDAVARLVFREADANEALGSGADQLIIVALVGLALNLISLCVLGHGHGHDHGHNHSQGHGHGHERSDAGPAPRRSLNMQGMLLHVAGDALGSVGVVVSGLIIKFARGDERFLADPLCSVVIVALLVTSTVPTGARACRCQVCRAPRGRPLTLSAQCGDACVCSCTVCRASWTCARRRQRSSPWRACG
jgi:zinc transporter 1